MVEGGQPNEKRTDKSGIKQNSGGRFLVHCQNGKQTVEQH